MAWFHASTGGADAGNHASAAEVVACFHDERPLLNRLAFLITGDHATADQSVLSACDITLQGHSPFRDCLLEWAKAATITSAISCRAEAIRACEADYENEHCSFEEPLPPGLEERAASLKLIFQANPGEMIAELDVLCRTVLVLTMALGHSIQDCVLRLNVCRPAVLAAASHAMSWLRGLDGGSAEEPQNLANHQPHSG